MDPAGKSEIYLVFNWKQGPIYFN